jgi:predicted permease
MQRPPTWLADLARDLRQSLRLARRTPLVTAVVIAILALTIGATTAIFSLVRVFFRDLPVRDPGRLVQFVYRYPNDPPMNDFALDEYLHDRDASTSFTDLIGTAPAFVRGSQIVRPDFSDVPGTIAAEFVTGNYFSGLGLQPEQGRVLTADDDRRGAPPAAVVSWAYWQRALSADPRTQPTISVANTPVPIVGVVDRRFTGAVVGYQPDVWLPVSLLPRAHVSVMAFARLKPGVTIAQAQSETSVVNHDWIERLGAKDPVWLSVKVTVESARSGLAVPLTDQFGRPVAALMVLVLGLLAIACANVGGLLLARGASRQQEIAVRLSLGATRWRLARQMLADAALLAAGGATAGLALAGWIAPVLLRTMVAGTSGLHGPAVLHVSVDFVVLGFTAAVATLAALLFGTAPAFVVRSTSPLSALKSGISGSGTRGRVSLGDLLVVVQVVLSFALLCLLQLYGAHLWRLRGPALGFDPNPVLILSVDTATGRSREAIAPLTAQALARLASLPGVRSAALSAVTPISGAAGSRFITVDGFQEPAADRRRAWLNNVSEGYFATLSTPIVAGRDFRASDATGARVAIVNQTLARHYFAGRNPLGKGVRLEGDETRPYEIIGVVVDAKYIDVRLPAPPTVYFDYPQSGGTPSQFTVRVSPSPSSVTAAATRVLDDVFGKGRVTKVTTLAEQVDGSIVPERLLASLASFFGGVGAILAAAGLYGLLAVAVARRTREIGVRMALGASRRSVMAAVMTRALTLVGCGIAVGVPLAFWARHIAAGMIEQVTPSGWLPLVAVAVATVLIGALGAALPARQAMRVDPLRALRAE